MTISISSSFMKRHCINVTRISDVNQHHHHHDALRRGMDDYPGHVFYQRVKLPVQMAWYHIKYNVRTMGIQCMYRINTRYALH